MRSKSPPIQSVTETFVPRVDIDQDGLPPGPISLSARLTLAPTSMPAAPSKMNVTGEAPSATFGGSVAGMVLKVFDFVIF